MRTIRSLLAALTALLLSQGAAASACLGASPFDDIAQNDPICSNTEWLKNRGVTLGCTTNLYCPLDNVSRAQMALFMNRLAIALVPSVNLTEDRNDNVDLDLITHHCVTPSYAITDFARKIVLIGHLTALFDAPGAVRVAIVHNTTGSATVFNLTTTAELERASASTATYAHASTSTAIDLDVGTTYRFAIRIDRQSGSGHAPIVRCNLLQMLQPRERNSILP
jgi:hypothetical protein